MKLIIVIPTYNEANNLPKLAEALFALPFDDCHLIIVDDNSPDGTGAVGDQLAAQCSGKITVIHRPGKLGLGSAYAQGFQIALELGADVVVQMDADFSHSPDYIPGMVRQLEKYDVVVGSRFVEGGCTDERWSWWRYLLSWWANQIYTRMILAVPVKDATAGFKVFRRQALAAIDLENVVSNGYVFQVEMAYICHKKGFRILEIPIYFEDRRIGQSKMDVPIKVEAVWRVWQIRWRYRSVKPVA
ncbi:MAG: polyprenol monophosphomannose synthase [Anaerolineae bacterium]